MAAKAYLKHLRLMTGVSVRQIALALGWSKSTYERYENIFAKPHLPARLASELVPVFEFFGVNRLYFRDLFEPGVALESFPPLVATLDPSSEPDASRIQMLLEIKAGRRKTRHMMFSLAPAHLTDFQAFAQHQQKASAEPPPELPRLSREYAKMPASPVPMHVLRSRSLRDGTLLIDFDNPTEDSAPFFLKRFPGLYGLPVVDDRAVPGHKIGEMLFAANLPVAPKDLVIVTYRSEKKSIGLCSIYATVVTIDEDYIEIAPFSARGTRIIRRGAIKRLDRVITKDELIGRASPKGASE